MHKRYKYLLLIPLALGVTALIFFFLQSVNATVLNPKGIIAEQERGLFIFALLLSSTIVLPVFGLTFGIAWRYRETNTKAKYTPDWDHNPIIEAIWWLVPLALITILSVVTWKSSHDLDPFKPLNSDVKPLLVQVVALQWKWLFIYPEQGIATVNFVEFPKSTPIDFEITSDAPMNSFWIPQLGGQIYAMSGMSTHLHLMADEAGEYYGSSANISGAGFAGMHFKAKSVTGAEFGGWVDSIKKMHNTLTTGEYLALARPSQNNEPAYYSAVDRKLYNQVVMKYMMPDGEGL